MKYAFIDGHRARHAVQTLCRALGVARSGYYAWRHRGARATSREQQRVALDTAVGQKFWARKRRYGAPRITQDLQDEGWAVDRKTVAASLQRQGLRAKAARRYKATTQSNHTLPVSPNRLEQDFVATAPNQKWVGDITYLHTTEGWLYLAVVIDLFSRRVIGWAMAERMTAELVCDALQMALWKRKHPQGVVVHSDRGSQYCSAAYQGLIRRYQLQSSMSAKGNCYDNACAESFFHSLKVEAIHGEPAVDRAQMRKRVFEYIEVDYNRQRRHSAIGGISPEAFEMAKRVDVA